MEIDAELLAVLRCPASGRKLVIAPAEVLAALNRRIAGGKVVNQGGRTIAETLSGGLLREDGALLYPVADGFPILLVDEAIPLGEGDVG